MKKRIARKILRFALRGLARMTTSQRRREWNCHWNRQTTDRAFRRLRDKFHKSIRREIFGDDSKSKYKS